MSLRATLWCLAGGGLPPSAVRGDLNAECGVADAEFSEKGGASAEDLCPGGRRSSVDGRPTILIVEDNELNLKLFNDLLQVRGYVTLRARTGSEGLAMAGQHDPDLVVLDIQLPDMSGLEVVRLMKQADGLRNIPIVVVTAYAMKGDEKKAQDAGCCCLLSKPVAASDLWGAVDRFLRGGSTANKSGAGMIATASPRASSASHLPS